MYSLFVVIKCPCRAAFVQPRPYWSHAQQPHHANGAYSWWSSCQDVTLEGLTALDGATWTNAETFFRAALGLHFGHVNAPFRCAREAFANRSANLLAPSHFYRKTFASRSAAPKHHLFECRAIAGSALKSSNSFHIRPQCQRPEQLLQPVWAQLASSCQERSS